MDGRQALPVLLPALLLRRLSYPEGGVIHSLRGDLARQPAAGSGGSGRGEDGGGDSGGVLSGGGKGNTDGGGGVSGGGCTGARVRR